MTNFPGGINLDEGELQIAGVPMTASAADLNKLDGQELTADDFAALAGLALGKTIPGQQFVVQYPNFAAADVAKPFFIAPAACKVVLAYEAHATKAGQAGVLTLEKLTSGQAPSAGAEVLATGGIDLTADNGVPTTVAALTTAAATLAAGNVLCLKLKSGAATSLANATLGVLLEWV